MMHTQTFTAIIHREENMYVVECPEVGTVSQGYTIDDSISNLKEATELYLEEFPVKESTKSIMTTFEANINV
jgi:predicted RNase H-like HicB family nuclease